MTKQVDVEKSEGWRLQDTVTIPALRVKIFIRTEHYPDPSSESPYFTFAFSQASDKHWVYQMGYESEEDARKGHQALIEMITKGEWELIPVKWILEYKGGTTG